MTANSDSPILVGGCPRSGTSWVHFLLASHPDTVTTRETHLYDKYVGPLKEWFDHEQVYQGRDGLSAIFSESDFIERILAPIVRQTFDQIVASQKRVGRIVEKTPGNMHHHSLILKIQPSARLLYVVRDPRAVVASYKAASLHDWGTWARKPASEVCASWNRYNAAYTAAAKSWPVDQIMAVRFEDLKADGHKWLTKLYEWAGLEIVEGLVEKAFIDNDISRLQSIGDDQLRADNRKGFFREGKQYGWVNELSLREIREIERICADFMSVWNYFPYRSAE